MELQPSSVAERLTPPDLPGGEKGTLISIERRKGDGFLAEFRLAFAAGKEELASQIEAETRRARNYLIGGATLTGAAVGLAIALHALGMANWGDMALQTPTTMVEALSIFLLSRHVWILMGINRRRNRLVALHEKKTAFFGALSIQDLAQAAAVLQSLIQPQTTQRPMNLLIRTSGAAAAKSETAK